MKKAQNNKNQSAKFSNIHNNTLDVWLMEDNKQIF